MSEIFQIEINNEGVPTGLIVTPGRPTSSLVQDTPMCAPAPNDGFTPWPVGCKRCALPSHCVFIFASAGFRLDLGWSYWRRHLLEESIAVAFIFLSLAASGAYSTDEPERHAPDIDMFASMAGKCTSVKVADRDFVCASVAFFHSPGGRSSFTIPLNDPDDDSHIITFG